MLIWSVMSNSLQPHGLQPARLLCPWGFSRQEYWCGLPFPPPAFPNQGLNPGSCIAGRFFSDWTTREVQEYWSIPSPWDLPDPEIELGSPALQADSLPTKLPGKHLRYRCTNIRIFFRTHKFSFLSLYLSFFFQCLEKIFYNFGS